MDHKGEMMILSPTRLVVAVFLLMVPSVAVGQQTSPPIVRKPVVAVTSVKDLANTGQGEAFSAMLQSAIASTSKFRVIENDTDTLIDQQKKARDKIYTTNTPGRIGGFEGADFLVSGKITSGGSIVKSDSDANTGRTIVKAFGLDLGGSTCSKQVSSLAVDITIVDAKTGEQKFTKRINRQSTSETRCSGDPQSDITALLRLAADDAASGLVTTIYPIKIAAVQPDGTIVLNYGEGTLALGQVLSVYGRGEKIVDPDSGAVLSDESAELGQIRVTEVTARFSRAVVTSPSTAPMPVGSIVRPTPPGSIKPGKKR